MEQAILGLFSTSFLVFALVVALASSIIRNVAEAIFRKLKIVIPDKYEGMLGDIWGEWILPVLPMIIGGLFAFIFTGYPFPAEFAATATARVFIGIVAGMISSTVYRFTKYHVKKYVPESVKSKFSLLKKPGILDEVPEEEETTVEETPADKESV
jgi:hypothetical protein